jgi:hypothetical protein
VRGPEAFTRSLNMTTAFCTLSGRSLAFAAGIAPAGTTFAVSMK